MERIVERESKNSTYAYVRASSHEQNEDRQLMALEELNIPDDNIFVDKKSGKDFERPEYQRLLKILKAGDILYVISIDRLGRDYREIGRQWQILTKEIGVQIVFKE